jgi:hypothetical protein
MISINGAVGSITAALETIRKDRARRIGSWTTKQFFDELVRQNRQIRAVSDSGPLRAQKILWFNYQILMDEIANIGAVFNVVEQLLDESVLDEIAAKGFDRRKVVNLIEEGKKMLARIRNDVALHEDSLARKIAGNNISDDSLNRIEYRIAGALSGLEDSILKTMPEVIGRATSHSEYSKPTRRGILTLFAKGVAAAMVLGVANVVNSAAYGQEAKASDITAEEIAEQMQKGTVEEILKGARVEYVKYDPTTKATNYDALVFQKHLRAEERKPVLVLFYHNRDPAVQKSEAVSQRDAILFRKFSAQLTGKIKFVCYDTDSDPIMAANNYNGFNKKLDILGIPSIAMYSQFNLTNGETRENNDGNIKRIDTLRGGPESDSMAIKLYNFINNKWIPTNFFGNGKGIWRLNNTMPWKPQEIAYK